MKIIIPDSVRVLVNTHDETKITRGTCYTVKSFRAFQPHDFINIDDNNGDEICLPSWKVEYIFREEHE